MKSGQIKRPHFQELKKKSFEICSLCKFVSEIRILFRMLISVLSVCSLLIQIACYNETIKAKINCFFLSVLNFACKVPSCKFAHGDATTSEATCARVSGMHNIFSTRGVYYIGSGRGFANDNDDHDHDHAVICVVLHSGMAGRGRQQMQIFLIIKPSRCSSFSNLFLE